VIAIELVALQKIYLVVDVGFAGEPMSSGTDSKRMQIEMFCLTPFIGASRVPNPPPPKFFLIFDSINWSLFLKCNFLVLICDIDIVLV
jgi:hypothetical protein